MLLRLPRGVSPLPKPKRIKKPRPKKSPSRPKPAVKSVPAARRLRRRQTLAGALLQGKTVTEVAKSEGLSRSHVSREANAPETRLLMAELLAAHRGKVARLVGKALTRIDLALDAHATEIVISDQERSKTKTGHTKEKRKYQSILTGVDHYARMTAAKRLVEMIAAARTEAVNSQAGLITWEMFLQLRERVQP